MDKCAPQSGCFFISFVVFNILSPYKLTYVSKSTPTVYNIIYYAVTISTPVLGSVGPQYRSLYNRKISPY